MKKRIILPILINILLLMVLTVLLSIKIYGSDDSWFLAGIILSTVLIVALIIQIFLFKNHMENFINKRENDICRADSMILNTLEASTVVVDSSNKIIWYNSAFFKEIHKSSEAYGLDFYKTIGISSDDFGEDGCAVSAVSGRLFRIVKCERVYDGTPLSIFFFNDITEFTLLKEKYDDTRMSVVLIVIDNYEDLFSNAKESDKAHVQASIERLFEDFMSQTNGLLRKMSKDRFIAIVEEQHLRKIIDDKFKILDNARSITVDERLNVTLSIGVGQGAASLLESEQFAKQSLDMALGRGGDQVAVKTENGFKFYGGVSKGIEKHSRIKTRIISTAMQELIHNCDTVFVMGHRYGDLDSVGAAAGLAGAINLIGSNAYVVVDHEKNLARPLINHLVAADHEALFVDEEEAVDRITEKSLLIIVDTHKRDILESVPLYERANHIIVIDHHRKNVNFIDNSVIFHHEPYASSASEMVAELIQYFKNLNKIPACLAEALLAGIMLDTKNFIMRTGVRTFEAAAYLKKMGADTIAVKELFSSSIDHYQKKARIVAGAELYGHCAVAVANAGIQGEVLRLIAPQASDELLNISDVDASFVIYDIGGVMNISARSLGNINVQVIMEKLGGGGHQTMAAAQLTGISAADARTKLFAAIDDYTVEMA